jgi:MFS family permease
MGLAYAPISLLMLREAPAGREGWASASLSLADVLGTALGIGSGGAAVASATAHGWPLAVGVGAAFAIAASAGLVLALVSRRLPRTLRTQGDHHGRVASRGPLAG